MKKQHYLCITKLEKDINYNMFIAIAENISVLSGIIMKKSKGMDLCFLLNLSDLKFLEESIENNESRLVLTYLDKDKYDFILFNGLMEEVKIINNVRMAIKTEHLIKCIEQLKANLKDLNLNSIDIYEEVDDKI